MKTYQLIQQEKTTIEEVLKDLTHLTPDTMWAGKTNHLAANYVRHLSEVYGDTWYRGFLPKELFLDILLPEHTHSIDTDVVDTIFPLDTPIIKALDFYVSSEPHNGNECMQAIHDLKEKIVKDGFTSTLTLAVINDSLKHVDGLHRALALLLAMNEGFVYKPIPVYLCNASA
jgi:hypothetical protein